MTANFKLIIMDTGEVIYNTGSGSFITIDVTPETQSFIDNIEKQWKD